MGALDLDSLLPDKCLILLQCLKRGKLHIQIHHPGKIVEIGFKFLQKPQCGKHHDPGDHRSGIKPAGCFVAPLSMPMMPPNKTARKRRRVTDRILTS